MTNIDPRFGGITRLYGEQPTQILNRSHVCVIGIGGVGSWIAEAFARSAVGKITLIDLDELCTTNINRQIHALNTTIGKSKVNVMKQRLLDINPQCQITSIEDFVTANNVTEHITDRFDYVVDATDSIKAKSAIIVHCRRNKIPILTIGGAGGQIDPTQIKIADLSKTIQDPLASKLRNHLRKDFGFSKNPKRKFNVDCVFSTEPLRYPQGDGTVSTKKHLADGSVKLDCNNGFGAAVVVTGSFGFIAAARVIDKLIERAQRQLNH
jgi:tRNA A37 threonylcarbamoyladenosine dehydratase